jgi:hypothetical protein
MTTTDETDIRDILEAIQAQITATPTPKSAIESIAGAKREVIREALFADSPADHIAQVAQKEMQGATTKDVEAAQQLCEQLHITY